MKDIFEIMTVSGKDERREAGICVGISLKIGGRETVCPISGVCNSYDALESEVQEIKENLENMLTRANTILNESTPQLITALEPDMEDPVIYC